ncbi:MAG: hypothetical protein PHP95_04180 [Desulfuromonadaceae bacterium]|nr:hypothetical protein [Desulfuromonadaceae bacterium]MDD2847634.1 hypothetical protein [Desulfuromonadaceae bacterium]MDD4131120.1 hypothetical protein [Desulfuromonadaceae bacterium]
MRIETKLSEDLTRFEYVDMTESEKLIVEDMKVLISNIFDCRLDTIIVNQQFKELTQEVADIINSIRYEIDYIQLDVKPDPADLEEIMALIDIENKRSEDIWYVRFETYLYCEKAKAAGINVSKSEVDALMIAYFEPEIVEASLVPEG